MVDYLFIVPWFEERRMCIRVAQDCKTFLSAKLSFIIKTLSSRSPSKLFVSILMF